MCVNIQRTINRTDKTCCFFKDVDAFTVIQKEAFANTTTDKDSISTLTNKFVPKVKSCLVINVIVFVINR